MTTLSVHRQNIAMLRGFTLIELLVVLVVLGLAMSIAAPALFRASDRARLDAATTQVYDGLRRARSVAVTNGAPVTLEVRGLVLDHAIEVRGVAPLIFYPDGSATPAAISLILGGERRGLTLDWLTGHAALAR